MFLKDGGTDDIQNAQDDNGDENPRIPSSRHTDIDDFADDADVIGRPISEVSLVCVSGSADFEAVRNWCNTVSQVSRMRR